MCTLRQDAHTRSSIREIILCILETISCDRFTLRMSSDQDLGARDHARTGIALNVQAERALLNDVPINSLFCAISLNGSVNVNSNLLTRHCLFICSSCGQRRFLLGVIWINPKFTFNRSCDRCWWFWRLLGYIKARSSLPSYRTDNSDYFIQVCFTSPDGLISDEASFGMQKRRFSLNSRHL